MWFFFLPISHSFRFTPRSFCCITCAQHFFFTLFRLRADEFLLLLLLRTTSARVENWELWCLFEFSLQSKKRRKKNDAKIQTRRKKMKSITVVILLFPCKQPRFLLLHFVARSFARSFFHSIHLLSLLSSEGFSFQMFLCISNWKWNIIICLNWTENPMKLFAFCIERQANAQNIIYEIRSVNTNENSYFARIAEQRRATKKK